MRQRRPPGVSAEVHRELGEPPVRITASAGEEPPGAPPQHRGGDQDHRRRRHSERQGGRDRTHPVRDGEARHPHRLSPRPQGVQQRGGLGQRDGEQGDDERPSGGAPAGGPALGEREFRPVTTKQRQGQRRQQRAARGHRRRQQAHPEDRRQEFIPDGTAERPPDRGGAASRDGARESQPGDAHRGGQHQQERPGAQDLEHGAHRGRQRLGQRDHLDPFFLLPESGFAEQGGGFGNGRRGRDARPEPSERICRTRRSSRCGAHLAAPGGQPRFAPQRRGDEALRHHPDDPHRFAVQHDLAADRVGRAAEGRPP